MMIRPKFLMGAKRAERGPMMTWGWLLVRMFSQRRWRVDCVCLEWRRVMLAKWASKFWTSWLVRAISGTRRMTDCCFFRVWRVSCR